MDKNEKQARTPLYFALSLLLMFSAAVTLVFVFMNKNSVRINDQNKQYLEGVAAQAAAHMEDHFAQSSMSIRMVSKLYELQLTTPEFDYHMLDDMSEPTPFSHIRFVSPDGVSWAGDGSHIDCTDREYYTEGMKGNSGIYYIMSSRFSSEPIITFYTPLYYEGQIIGVVNGIMDMDSVTAKLETRMFGESTSPCICLPDGTVIASSFKSGGFAQARASSPLRSGALDERTLREVMQALAECRSITFNYAGTEGEGLASITPIADGEFLLVQNFPSTVVRRITGNANRDSIKLEIWLVGLFLCYVIVIIIYYIHRSRRLVLEKNNLGQIVDSVKHLYRRFVVIDLENDRYEYLEGNLENALDLPPDGNYSDWLDAFRKANAEFPESWSKMDDMTPESLRETLTKEKWFSHREYATPDGRWERISLIKLDMDSDITEKVLGAVEDITEAKQKDTENRIALESAFHAAESASKAKSEFLSRMSHDIRTPMNAIVGLTAIMGAHLDDRERLTDCLTKITSSSKHLLSLINEVLDMSKIESGKLILSEEDFSLSTMIDELLSIIQPEINARHQELSVHIVNLEHENVTGDFLRLQQVCVNILSNSVKYTGEGGHVSMTLREKKSKIAQMSDYELIFEDDGIGMDPEFVKRIFNPFERADDERVSEIQGTGLGMSIARSIVQLMGGTISVESEQGKGSRFTVQIPLSHKDISEGPAEQLIGLPVLVVDDEQIACESACQMLSELGMESEWVLSGMEAVDKVKAHRADDNDYFAVILDWKMPVMDGLETAKAIRREVGDDIPIIILSAYDWSEIEAEARAAGVNTFISKPLFKSGLRSTFVDLISDKGHDSEDPLGAVKERDFTGKHVLLAEDNELNQEIAKEILEMTGLDVDVAENGKVAVEEFLASPENHYDMVFMDIQMPIMNGYEATRAIRALPREDASAVPIVAMSANTFSEDVKASIDSGMVQHIGKPLNMDQLMDVLDKWLGNSPKKKNKK